MHGLRKIIFVISFAICLMSAGYIIAYTIDDYKSQKLTGNLADMHQSLVAETETAEPETAESIQTTVQDTEESIIQTTVESVEENVEKSSSGITHSDIIVSGPEELTILDSIAPFYNINNDTAGWLTINGTKIDNVVVQTMDNYFYLDHDFNKVTSQPGTLFADYRCCINNFADWQSNVLTIYGHNQKTGSMLGTLDNYKNDIDFYRQYPTFTFSNLYENYVYKIVGMFVCKTAGTPGVLESELFLYHDFIDFNDTGYFTFQNWVDNIERRSQVNTGVDMLADDKYIVLSTCSYEFINARFVVIGRRVRIGESPEVDTSQAALNDNPLI